MPPPSRRQPPPRRVRPRPFPTSPHRDETCPLGRRATTIVSTLTTVDPPTLSHAQRPTATAAETRLFARVADRSPSSDASASLDAATSPDLRDHLRDHLRDDHAVAIRDGRTDAETAACDARLAAARARVASFSTRVRAAGGGVGGVATLPDTHGDYGTLRRRGDAWTAFNKRPDRIRDALAADPNLPRCPHLVGNAPSRHPHVLVSHRDAPGLSRAALGAEGRVRVAAYCAQCWENLETKRLAAAVACADCGDAFPRGKTRAYPVLTRPGAGRVDVDVFSKRHVDVCFLCAPRWEVRAAEDAERRARDEVEDAANASADAAARAFAELPMDERVAIVDAELRRRKGADGEGADGESADGEGADGARVDGEGADGMPVDGHPVDGVPTLGRVPAAPRHPRDADALYAAAETETAAAERLTAELVDSDARASSSARAARPGETHALLPRRAYDDPRDERRKPRDRPLRLGAADLAESAILRAMLRDGKYEEMLEFARRVEPPTDPSDGGDGGADVPLGNRALAVVDATATAARRAVVAAAREHLGDDAKANEAADVVERAAERAAVAAMTSAGLLRTDRGEDPRGDVGESAAFVDPLSVLADALRRFGDDADAAVAAAAAAESRATAEAFRARALGDAAAAEARALAADRARLLEIIDAERGAYPLAANPAAASEAAEKEAREGASKKASEAAFWGDVGLDDDEGEREETPEERDAREREERAKEAEEARRRARDERFAKLERWARSGVDLSAYDEADEGGSNANGDGEQSRRRGRRPDAGHSASELLAFRARVAAALEDTESRLAADAFLERRAGAPKEAPNGASSETSKEEAHAASKEEAWLCRLRASLLETRADVDEALARADVDPRDADVDPRDSGRRPQTLKTAAARASVENVADVDAAPSEVGVPIGTPAFARVGTLSPVEDATEVPSEASPPDASSPKASPPRNRWAAALALTRAREKPPAKKPPRARRRATVDAFVSADVGHALPAHPKGARRRRPAKTTRPKASKETTSIHASKESTESNAAARANAGLSLVDARDVAASASVPSFASDSDDSGEVSIPLRTALRVAAELPTALSPADAEKSPERPGRSRDASRRGDGFGSPRDRDAIANRDRVSPEDTAFEQALARREIRVREAHVRLRARTLGLVRAGAGAAEDDPIPGEAVAAAILSRGAAVPPIPFVDGTANADNADDVDSTTIARKRAGVSSLGLAYDPADEDARRAVERATRPLATRASSTTGKEPSRNRPREMDKDELVAERRRERTRRIHDALRAKGRRAYPRAVDDDDDDDDRPGTGDYRVDVAVRPRRASAASPGEWARKEREYHERLAVETPAMPSRIARDVESGAHARLLANANADASEEEDANAVDDAFDADFDPGPDPDADPNFFPSPAEVVAAAAEELDRLARAHAPPRPPPDAHLLAERAGSSADSDSDVAADDAASPVFSDDVPTPTLLDLDDPPATPESDPPTPTPEPSPEEPAPALYRDANGVLRRSTSVPARLFSSPASDGESDGGGVASDGDHDVSGSGIGGSERVSGSESDGSDSPSPAPIPAPDTLEDDYDARERTLDALVARVRADAAAAAAAEESGTFDEHENPNRHFGGVLDTLSAEDDRNPRRRRQPRVLAASFSFAEATYAAVAGPQAHPAVARAVTSELVRGVSRRAGVDPSRVVVVGFSRGAVDPVTGVSAAEDETFRDATRRDEKSVPVSRALVVHVEVTLDDRAWEGRPATPPPRDAMDALKRLRRARTPHIRAEALDTEAARAARRERNDARWRRLRDVRVALADAAAAGCRGCGSASLHVRGAGDPGDFPPPSPPPLVDLFAGNRAAAAEWLATCADQRAEEEEDDDDALAGPPEDADAEERDDDEADENKKPRGERRRDADGHRDAPSFASGTLVDALGALVLVTDAHANRRRNAAGERVRLGVVRELDDAMSPGLADSKTLVRDSARRRALDVRRDGDHARIASRVVRASAIDRSGSKGYSPARSEAEEDDEYAAEDEYVNPRLERARRRRADGGEKTREGDDAHGYVNPRLARLDDAYEYVNPRLARLAARRR